MKVLAKFALLASTFFLLTGQVTEAVAAHAQAAQAAERSGDFATAVREFESVVAALPENAEMQSNLGVALYFDHQLSRASSVFKKAIALNRSLVAPHLFLGLALFRLSNPDAAVPELETAARLNDSDVLAHTWLGYAYSAQSRYDLALRQFETASSIDPNNVDVWYALGQSDLQIGRAATLELLAVAPDGARTWQLAGEQAQLQGDRRDALENFRAALARRPDLAEVGAAITELGETPPAAHGDPRPINAKEDVLYKRAHEAEQQARAAFERVVRIAPESYRAHQILGDSLTIQDRPEDAIAEYRAVLKLNPDLPGIHEAIGKNLLSTGKEAAALVEFQAELEIQPNSASATMYTGNVLLLMGDEEGAHKMLTRALHLDRPPLETYRLLGKLDLHRNDYRAATKELAYYVSVRRDNSSAFYLLSKAYAAVGEQQQSRQALALFEKTSRDAKMRSRAQAKLEAFNNPTRLADETAEPGTSATPY